MIFSAYFFSFNLLTKIPVVKRLTTSIECNDISMLTSTEKYSVICFRETEIEHKFLPNFKQKSNRD